MTRALSIIGALVVCSLIMSGVQVAVEALSLHLGSSAVTAAYRSGGAGGIVVSFGGMWISRYLS
jgi:hypothetical protein